VEEEAEGDVEESWEDDEQEGEGEVGQRMAED
jgi:hypothetical protein